MDYCLKATNIIQITSLPSSIYLHWVAALFVIVYKYIINVLPDSAMESLPSDYHVVALSGDRMFRQDRRKFGKIRLMIHPSNTWPISGISENHVPLYLIVENSDNVVRVDIRTDPPNLRGILIWLQRKNQVL